MSNSTVSGPWRSEGGFQHISKNATTGAITATDIVDSDGRLEAGLNVLPTAAGTGITGGTGTVYAAAVERTGGMVKTTIMVDLTGLRSTGANDIIGVDGTSNPCHIGQLTAAVNGTILMGSITCFETPAGGDPDIDLYCAVEATGVEDGVITDLDETKLINHGDWAAEETDILDTMPVADEYLYLVAGAATDADYTAGKILIELWGYDA